jgi:solute carrier family 25 (mitochondrial adenine nucleotide translocator), member 4/5/6/31
VNFAQDRSAWQVAVDVYREQGLLAFWRGNWPNVLRVAGNSAINFSLMDYYKKVAVAPALEVLLIQRHATTEAQIQRKRGLVTSFVSGGLAGATSTTVLYPFEFLRTRLAMDVGTSESNRTWHGMSHIVRNILRTDGVLGFFQGYGIALFGGVFYRLLFLGGYDALKSELLLMRTDQEELTLTQRFACAQTISLTSGTLCYPLDSVRRRMMMQAGVPRAERKYVNSIDCFAKILRYEGVRGFYLGIGPNLLRSVSGAILLVCYDTFKVLLR